MIQMKLQTLLPLTEALPTNRLFYYMANSGVSFIPDTLTASYLDDEYFYNYSGNKQSSPLLEHYIGLVDQTEQETATRLAAVILNRYSRKWEQLFRQYSSLSTLSLLDNINLTRETEYGKTTTDTSTSTLTKSGREIETIYLDESRTESYNPNNPRTTSRAITGRYTDAINSTATRSGTEETTESFPSPRKSTRTTTGAYSDADTVKNTRTGSTLQTDKGGMQTSVFGFNSSSPSPSSLSAPADPSTGVTTETTYGTNGLIDAHSGAVTRTYDATNPLKEELEESGTRKTATTFGENGLVDKTSGGTTRSYDNYRDDVTESGEKTLQISYGQNGRRTENEFANRSDATASSSTFANSGADTETETGFRYNSLIDEYMKIFMSSEYLDFLSIVFDDCDEVLTCSYYV